ncbi:MAG: galactokinase family protein [Anaerolineae bacterium]
MNRAERQCSVSGKPPIGQLRKRLKVINGCDDGDIRLVRSPLRVSPLGAHVDHQDGLVTGMTLDRAIYLAFVPREDDLVRVESLNFPGRVTFNLSDVPPRVPGEWGNYARGAALALIQSYDIQTGLDAVVAGTMPIGGLSSSAAVGIAYLLALETVNDLQVLPRENIELDRYVENVYLGLRNGVLDQSVILLSARDCLTHIDCGSMEIQRIPTAASSDEFEILVVYSGVQKALTGTDYNSRVAECQAAARMLLDWSGLPSPNGTSRLRLVPSDIYAEYGDRLPAPLDRRARHFFTELQRVEEGVVAWRNGDLETVGALVRASGASSVYNYESGCPHLTTLYHILSECPGVYGARFSGGGFRGSCIALSHPQAREEITAFVESRYPQAYPDIVESYSIHFCQTDGAACLLDSCEDSA